MSFTSRMAIGPAPGFGGDADFLRGDAGKTRRIQSSPPTEQALQPIQRVAAKRIEKREPIVPEVPRLMTIGEVAEKLRYSQWQIRKLNQDGQLVAIIPTQGGPWRFDPDDVIAFLEKSKTKGPR